MDISMQNVDKVSALLTVKIDKADYEENVSKSLKTLRQKAQIPGFRKGMVPMGLIQKMYRKSVIAEEVNKLISEKLYGYIKENNIAILGDPLPNEEKQPEIDFDTMDSFEFLFDIALAPEFEVSITDKDEVDYYTIDVTDKMIDEQVKAYAQRHGEYKIVDTVAGNDMLKGELVELDENGQAKEGGKTVAQATIMPSYIKDEAQKSLFDNAKTGDTIVFNPNKAYEGNEAEIASLLDTEKAHTADIKADFSFKIAEISRFAESEVNQQLFDEVFGKDVVSNEADFRTKVKETIASSFVANSDYKFLLDAHKYIVEKVGKFEFADTLLKRMMLANNEEKGENYVNEHYDKNIEELTWQLIMEKLIKQYEIKIEENDIIAASKEYTKAQFAQYGMSNIPDEILNNYSQEMLKKKENVNRMVNHAIEIKFTAKLKETMKLNNKTISLEEFNKLFS
jgi:trigger factor